MSQKGDGPSPNNTPPPPPPSFAPLGGVSHGTHATVEQLHSAVWRLAWFGKIVPLNRDFEPKTCQLWQVSAFPGDSESLGWSPARRAEVAPSAPNPCTWSVLSAWQGGAGSLPSGTAVPGFGQVMGSRGWSGMARISPHPCPVADAPESWPAPFPFPSVPFRFAAVALFAALVRFCVAPFIASALFPLPLVRVRPLPSGRPGLLTPHTHMTAFCVL